MLKSTVQLATLTLKSSFRFARTASQKQRNLYDILGVNRSSEAKDIKKAYYKLAQQYHPDKNVDGSASDKDKDKFAEISNAYDILSDAQKRKVYDQTGSAEFADSGEQAQQPNYEDIFSQFSGQQGQGAQNMGGFQDFFSNIFGGGGKGRQNTQQQQNQKQTYTVSINLTFDESVNGLTKTLRFHRQCKCSACNGKKHAAGSPPQKCNTCSGRGFQTVRQGAFIMQTTCNSCQGQGQKIKKHCSTCSGTGVEEKVVEEDVTFPRGIDSGNTIKLQGKGNFGGDLAIKVNVDKKSGYNRQGSNVHTDLEVPVVDAILGGNRKVKTIYGQEKEVKIPAGCQPGDRVTLPLEGFYIPNSKAKGNHIFNIKVTIPKKLKPQEQELYQKLKALN